MNTSLLWLGILPVIAFVILESFSGRRKGLIGALILGLAELAFTLVKFRTLDYLTLLAFGLLAAFVFISLKTDNDFFFKIQGAVVNIVFALFILIFQYILGKFLMLDMAVKYIGLEKLAEINPALNERVARALFTAMNTHLPWWLLAHSALTIYAAAKWNKWIWVAIRVPGFYLMLFIAAQFMAAALRAA